MLSILIIQKMKVICILVMITLNLGALGKFYYCTPELWSFDNIKVVLYTVHKMNFYLFSLTHSTMKRLAVVPYGGIIMDVVAIFLVVTVIMQVMITVITPKLLIHSILIQFHINLDFVIFLSAELLRDVVQLPWNKR